MLDSAFHLAEQVMPMRYVTHMDVTAEPASLKGDNVVFEDTWSLRMYDEVLQASQIHISD